MSDLVAQIKPIIEALLFAAEQPASVHDLFQLLHDVEQTSLSLDQLEKQHIRIAIAELQQACQERGIELIELATGFQYRVKTDYSPFLAKLWQERPPRYSRALLETLALIIYRQPVTRAEIEAVRGVAVSSHIIRTLLEREWVKIIGYKDVPGKPALFGTTKQLLDYFNLKSLKEFPPLESLANLDAAGEQLEIDLSLDNPPAIDGQIESETNNKQLADTIDIVDATESIDTVELAE